MGNGKKRPAIDAETCTGCGVCVDECPKKCLELVDDISKLVRPGDCDGCGTCAEACPLEAISMK